MSNIYLKAKSIPLLRNEVIQLLIAVSILFCCAQISIPLTPVPITLQSVGVLMIGLFYSRATAVKSVLAYLALGAIGAPVFANFSGGLSVLCGARAGYLVGFLAAVIAMSYFREIVKKETSFLMFLNCLLGTCCIFTFGVSWLTCLFGFSYAIKVGLLPFIVPGTAKAFLLAKAAHTIKK